MELGGGGNEGQGGQQGQGARDSGPRPLADLAVVDVPGDALAQKWGEPSVPVAQQCCEFLAFPAPTAGDEESHQAAFDPLSDPSHEDVRVRCLHPECVGEVLALEPVAELEIENGAISSVEACRGALHQLGQFLALDRRAEVVVYADVVESIDRGRSVPHASKAFVAGDGVEPWPDLVWVAQLTDSLRREQESVLNGVGRVVGRPHDRPAVVV